MAFKILNTCIGCAVCTKVCPVNAITGERGTRHHVDAGRCIDCCACGYICPQSAVADAQGQLVRRIRFRKNWPKPEITEDRCISCLICVDTCPPGCLEWAYSRDTADTKGYPILANPRACIACTFCEQDCPVDAIEMSTPESS